MISTVLAFITSMVVSYLIGSIPSAYLVGRAFKGIDIRKVGSHNMGAMNTFYTIGFWPGMLVLASDVCKGILAVLLAYLIATFLFVVAGNMVVPVEMAAGIAVIAGHNFPIFLNFKGGKGGATAIGVLAFLLAWINWVDIGSIKLPLPLGDLIFLGSFLILTLVTRWPTAAYAISFIAFWLIAWFVYKDTGLFIYAIFLTAVPVLMYIPRIKEIWAKSGHNFVRGLFRRDLKDRL
ncbi:MAG: glycerol-3-phosphate acyltransferase [Chloroflexi bacterium]|nr:glycerol-3-phosphate acyltransferase [Chloroflexota bacterium]